ncbi:MAG: YcxB family protein [Candidatus Heimdallarchaeota archaeon]|nr:YcxB family protein [Candidatus Heimdallarchaeota archaeon]
MAEENLEMEINYIYSFEDYKKGDIRSLIILSLLCIIVFPVIILSIFELIMILINLHTGYSEFDLMLMITFPSVYGLCVILFIPTTIIFLSRQWKLTKKLPQEEKWTFNSYGITYDKIYDKKMYTWQAITKVQESKYDVVFLLTNRRRINAGMGMIPKRVLDKEKLNQLYNVLKKYLGIEKLAFKSIIESKQNI